MRAQLTFNEPPKELAELGELLPDDAIDTYAMGRATHFDTKMIPGCVMIHFDSDITLTVPSEMFMTMRFRLTEDETQDEFLARMRQQGILLGSEGDYQDGKRKATFKVRGKF